MAVVLETPLNLPVWLVQIRALLYENIEALKMVVLACHSGGTGPFLVGRINVTPRINEISKTVGMPLKATFTIQCARSGVILWQVRLTLSVQQVIVQNQFDIVRHFDQK